MAKAKTTIEVRYLFDDTVATDELKTNGRFSAKIHRGRRGRGYVKANGEQRIYRRIETIRIKTKGKRR